MGAFGRISAFVSYDSRDRGRVVTLIDRLRPYGVDGWIDHTRIPPGSEWQAVIKETLKTCDVVLPCISRRWATNTGFLKAELELALQMAHTRQPLSLIPVRLEKCELPESLQHLHAYDVFDPDGFPPLLQMLENLMPQYRGPLAELAFAARELDQLLVLSQHESRLSEVEARLSNLRARSVQALVSANRAAEARELAAISPHPSFRLRTARMTSQIVSCRKYIESIADRLSRT